MSAGDRDPLLGGPPGRRRVQDVERCEVHGPLVCVVSKQSVCMWPVCVSEMEIQHPWNEFAVENMPLWCKREFAEQKATVTLPVSRPGWKINSCDADKNGSCFRKHIIPKRTADHLNWSVSQSVSQSAWCGSRVSFQAITGKTTPQHFLYLVLSLAVNEGG